MKLGVKIFFLLLSTAPCLEAGGSEQKLPSAPLYKRHPVAFTFGLALSATVVVFLSDLWYKWLDNRITEAWCLKPFSLTTDTNNESLTTTSGTTNSPAKEKLQPTPKVYTLKKKTDGTTITFPVEEFLSQEEVTDLIALKDGILVWQIKTVAGHRFNVSPTGTIYLIEKQKNGTESYTTIPLCVVNPKSKLPTVEVNPKYSGGDFDVSLN